MPCEHDLRDDTAKDNREQSANALKPCPFCGGAPRLSKDYDPDTGGVFYAYRCRGCRAQSGEKYAVETCSVFYAELRDNWNTRPPVAVKPLVFSKVGVEWQCFSHIGLYLAAKDGDVWKYWFPNSDPEDTQDGDTVDEDKALRILQADYERRILSCLVGGGE